MTNMIRRTLLVVLLATASSACATFSTAPMRPPLADSDVADIATLVMLEDTRELDATALSRILRSSHPEVRRLAARSIGRINNPSARSLLVPARSDADTAVVATVAFSTGQLKDSASVPWLASLLTTTTPPTVSREAARSLGKIRTPEARAALARYLADAPVSPANAATAGEALLAIGRSSERGDVAPLVRWTQSPDEEVRWRATWALFRPRNPAALPHLLRLTEDASANVRSWAVRGLTPAAADTAGIPRQQTSQRLHELLNDPDRAVRTEALRALGLHDDDASFNALLAALDADDTWISVSAAEFLGRFTDRAPVVVPRLVAAAAPANPIALRATALASLATLAPASAIDVAEQLARGSDEFGRSRGRQTLNRLGDAGRTRLEALDAANPPGPTFTPMPVSPPDRTLADYRAIVERWVVPDYNGAPRPRVVWDTPRGEVEIELYPGDAPLAVEYLLRVVESGDIVGAEFTRVVPDFVAQQRAISNAQRLRDEVSRLGLTRGNLSWASSGLDTGRPGYTLGHTPQPHNEGDFTALGRVVRGMDAVDRLELGDPVTATRRVR